VVLIQLEVEAWGFQTLTVNGLGCYELLKSVSGLDGFLKRRLRVLNLKAGVIVKTVFMTSVGNAI
jgi:hypothetical protein